MNDFDTPERHYRVILVDDDQEIMEDVRLAIEADPDITVLETATCGTAVLDMVKRLHPDVALLDVEMPVMDGIEATRRVKARFPEVGIIMLTNFRHDAWLKEALEAGADGFLTKDSSRADIAGAIKRVALGGRVMSSKPLNMLIDKFNDQVAQPEPSFTAGVQALTPAEHQVWLEALNGKGNAQIAKSLGVTEATVKTHISAVMRKFQVRSRAELLVFCARNGAIHS